MIRFTTESGGVYEIRAGLRNDFGSITGPMYRKAKSTRGSRVPEMAFWERLDSIAARTSVDGLFDSIEPNDIRPGMQIIFNRHNMDYVRTSFVVDVEEVTE